MTLDKLKTGESAVIKAVGGEGALRSAFSRHGTYTQNKGENAKACANGRPS